MPKAHYENALFKAQCEGTWHGGMSSDGNQGAYTGHLPWFKDNVFTKNGPLDSNRWQKVLHGIDFMLMYNMYRMAEINHWQNGSGTLTANRTQCPCKTYPSMRYTNYTPSILEESSTSNFTVDGRTYNNAPVMVPKTTLFSETKVVKPVYDFYEDFNTRIPNYLLHDANVSGQTVLVFVPPFIFRTDTLFGHIKVEKDLTICNSKLRLFSFGKLSIDESANTDFPSKIIVTAGSELELNHESLLEINNNTQVIIEKGATMRIWPDSRIVLNGPNAILHINGKLALENNAVFQPVAGTQGYGKVIFENNAGELYVQAKGNNKIIIDAEKSDARTNGNTHSANIRQLGNYHLEAKGAYGMHTGWAGHGMDSFIIRNSIALISDGSQITSEAKHTYFTNVYIGGELYKRSRGVNLYQSRGRIENTMIKYVENGVEYKPVNIKDPLYLDDVNIEDCYRSVWSQGGTVKVTNSHFSYGYYQGKRGIEIDGATGISSITKSDIVVPVYKHTNTPVWDTTGFEIEKGILHFGNSFLALKETDVRDGLIGIDSRDGNLRMQCSKVRSLSTPANAVYGVIKHGGYLNARLGYNQFTDHEIRIYSYKALTTLDHGYNLIDKSNSYFLDFVVHPRQPLGNTVQYIDPVSTSPGVVNPTCILATNNHWIASSTSAASPGDFVPNQATGANLNLPLDNGGGISFQDLGYYPMLNMTQLYNDYQDASCPRTPTRGSIYDTDIGISPDKLPTGGLGGVTAANLPTIRPGTINSGHNYGTGLIATVNKLGNGTTIDYGEVIPELQYWVQGDLADTLFELAYYTYSITQAAYYESLHDTALTDSALAIRNQDFGDTLLSVQDLLIDKAENSDPFWADLNYELKRDKSLILRSLDRRPEAIIVLDSLIQEMTETVHLAQANAWKCFIEQEQMVLDSIIPIDSLNFKLCINDQDFTPAPINSGNGLIQLTKAKTLASNQMLLFPNPTDNGFYLTADYEIQKENVLIFDASGKQVTAPIKANTEKQLFIDASKMKSGLYTVNYQTGEQKKLQFKVTVLR